MEAQDVFERFKRAYPNNHEPYNPSEANVHRWIWHLNNQPQRAEGRSLDVHADARRIAKSRVFGDFEAMPEYMRKRYLEVASLFPAREVWVTGSRANGQWIDPHDGGFLVEWMREQFRKIRKQESDYDFWVALPQEYNLERLREVLPKWADFLPNILPGENKILIR